MGAACLSVMSVCLDLTGDDDEPAPAETASRGGKAPILMDGRTDGKAPAQQRPPSAQDRKASGSRRPSKLWVADGRIYNYKKEGAVEVGG
jgi:hypothetical protein